MKKNFFIFFICILLSSASFANQKEISKLNNILTKGYNTNFVPYVKKQTENTFTCNIKTLKYRENKGSKIQIHNVPIKDRDAIIFKTSNNFHFATLGFRSEKVDLGIYHKAHQLNREAWKSFLFDNEKIDFKTSLPNKSNNYIYSSIVEGFQKNKKIFTLKINFNLKNNFITYVLEGSHVKKEVGVYSASFNSKCEGKKINLNELHDESKKEIAVIDTKRTYVYCHNEKNDTYYKRYDSCWGNNEVQISKLEWDKKSKSTVPKKELKQTVKVSKDTRGPNIRVNNSFEAGSDLIAKIEGSVSDDNEIVQVTVDGTNVSFTNGKFNQPLFVKPNGQSIIITAMDKFGNQSSKRVQLKRSNNIIAAKIFEDLNPTLIKAKINPSAVAIIIGIEEYQTTFAAPFAKKDALAFNDFAHTSLGVPRQNIKLLMNDNAGRTNTLKALAKWLPKMVREDQTDVYIFFSGHGLASEDGEELYLLPYDGEPDLLEDSTLLRNQLFDRVAKLNPRSVTVFLDTCYSGATRTEEFLVAAKPIFIEAQEQDIPAKFSVFSASAGRETAKVLKEAEHGLFSYYMMKGLEGEADANSDNQITNGELIAFINKNVSRQANQTPQLNGDTNHVLVQW